tara:strand:- start:454 stop:1104 length:651 start_codon:yes stop_codon:yes gene_type:complete
MAGFRRIRKSGTKPSRNEESGRSLLNRLRTQRTHLQKSRNSSKVTSTTPFLEYLESVCKKKALLSKAKESLLEILHHLLGGDSRPTQNKRLYQTGDKELAGLLVEVLNNNLPVTLRATVVRDTEVNVYDCLELDEEYAELMDYILWYREKYIDLDNDERERKIFRRNIKGVIAFAKTQVPNWKQKASQSRHYNAHRRGEAQKRTISQKDDSFTVEG